jgi:hypothetical protein
MIDFSIPAAAGGETQYLVPAVGAFAAMAAALFAVAMVGKRPASEPPTMKGKVVLDDIGLQEGP